MAQTASGLSGGPGEPVLVYDRIGTNNSVNWQVFREGRTLHDPETGEVLGIEAKYVGDARVRRFGNPSTLEITKAREEINRGDRLTPAREAAVPSYMPRAGVFRSFIMNHVIHHRGQLSVYLRLCDVALPSIYGPTADTQEPPV